MDKNKIPGIVTILGVQLFLLFIANVWNAWIIINSAAESNLFYPLDFFWPVAGILLLMTSIMILNAKNVKGWKKYTLFFAILLLHFAAFILYNISGRHNATMVIGGAYSFIAWMLLGYVVASIFSMNRTKSLKEKYESNSKYMLAIN